ncbi:hypothetical protein CY34DRAFT_764995, partial [Suillus luteus UH-Slu-Lm8-n1]
MDVLEADGGNVDKEYFSSRFSNIEKEAHGTSIGANEKNETQNLHNIFKSMSRTHGNAVPAQMSLLGHSKFSGVADGSETSRDKLYKRWGAKRDIKKVKEAVKKDLYIHEIKEFPSDFLAIKRSGKTVRKIVKKQYSATSTPQQLRTLPSKGKILLPLDHLPPASVPDDIPPYLIMRFEHFITVKQQKGLRARWDRLLQTKPKHLLKQDKNRSATDAYHLGTWEVTGVQPRLTLETEAQSPEAIKAMDDLLFFIKTTIAPKIATVFKDHAPTQWEALQ